jgi:solute:Na+ symporter, SSS family
VLSIVLKFALPDLPFLDRMAVVFIATLVLAVVVSLIRPQAAEANQVVTRDVSYTTPASFNIAALAIVMILVALYATWW